MIGHEFEVTTRPDSEGRMIIEMHGDITGPAREVLERVHPALDQPGLTAAVLDFEDVDYINSTGIALIVGLLARARAANLEVVAHGLSAHYREIFQITRLADFMGIFPDRTAALQAAPA